VAVTRDDSGGRSAGDPPGSQGALFEADETLGVAPEIGSGSAQVGYRGPTACSAAGITYRQLDYWARTGLVEPSVRAAHGSGSQRLYSFRDILVLKVVKRLLDTGISLQQIRAAVQHLRDHGSEDLAQVTLMSDGVSVYECTSADEPRLARGRGGPGRAARRAGRGRLRGRGPRVGRRSGRPGQAPPAPHELTPSPTIWSCSGKIGSLMTPAGRDPA